MKKLIIIVAMVVLGAIATQAQEVVRQGNTFIATKTTHVTDTTITQFKYQDSRGIEYPIIINNNTGRCYIYKTSAKTGKLYKSYMTEQVSREVCRELGYTYVEKQTSSK